MAGRKSAKSCKRTKGRRNKSGGSKKRTGFRRVCTGPPRRAPSPFIIYYLELLRKLQKGGECPEISKLAKQAAKCWRKLSDKDKAKYQKRYCTLWAKVKRCLGEKKK